MYRASGSPLIKVGFREGLMCSGYPDHANTPGVFDRTGGHFHIFGVHFREIQKSKLGKRPD